MRSIISGAGSLALIVASFASIALPTTPAHAESWSQTQCEANGGTYTKSGSDSTCVYPAVTTKPGNNPPGPQGSEQTTQTTTDGTGNLNNKQETTTTCTGHKCPR